MDTWVPISHYRYYIMKKGYITPQLKRRQTEYRKNKQRIQTIRSGSLKIFIENLIHTIITDRRKQIQTEN